LLKCWTFAPISDENISLRLQKNSLLSYARNQSSGYLVFSKNSTENGKSGSVTNHAFLIMI